jgi:hypothetical protein
VTSYGWTIRGSNTSKRKKFFSPSYGPDWFWFLTSLLFNGYRGCFPWVKWRRFDMEWTTQLHLMPMLRMSSSLSVEPSWNVMVHGDARQGKWRGNWRMEWVASTLHTTSEHGVSSITNVDAHTSAASSRLNWCPRQFKWTRPFRRKTKSGFCACTITFQTQATPLIRLYDVERNNLFFTYFVLISNEHRYSIASRRLASSHSVCVIEVGVYSNQWYRHCFCSYRSVPCQE